MWRYHITENKGEKRRADYRGLRDPGGESDPLRVLVVMQTVAGMNPGNPG